MGSSRAVVHFKDSATSVVKAFHSRSQPLGRSRLIEREKVTPDTHEPTRILKHNGSASELLPVGASVLAVLLFTDITGPILQGQKLQLTPIPSPTKPNPPPIAIGWLPSHTANLQPGSTAPRAQQSWANLQTPVTNYSSCCKRMHHWYCFPSELYNTVTLSINRSSRISFFLILPHSRYMRHVHAPVTDLFLVKAQEHADPALGRAAAPQSFGPHYNMASSAIALLPSDCCFVPQTPLPSSLTPTSPIS